jgi:hypothetical protein
MLFIVVPSTLWVPLSLDSSPFILFVKLPALNARSAAMQLLWSWPQGHLPDWIHGWHLIAGCFGDRSHLWWPLWARIRTRKRGTPTQTSFQHDSITSVPREYVIDPCSSPQVHQMLRTLRTILSTTNEKVFSGFMVLMEEVFYNSKARSLIPT